FYSISEKGTYIYSMRRQTKRRVALLCIAIITASAIACWLLPRFADAAKSAPYESTVIGSPVAFVDESFVRKVNLLANDLAVDPITQTIYVSTPSSALQNGTSIAP